MTGVGLLLISAFCRVAVLPSSRAGEPNCFLVELTVLRRIAVGDAKARKAITTSVINMSIGGPTFQPMDDMCSNATAAGMTVVVAASNYGADASTYSPARSPGAITVAAIDRTDTRPSWSNYGKSVALFAPGTDISSAWFTSDGAYASLSGTSMGRFDFIVSWHLPQFVTLRCADDDTMCSCAACCWSRCVSYFPRACCGTRCGQAAIAEIGHGRAGEKWQRKPELNCVQWSGSFLGVLDRVEGLANSMFTCGLGSLCHDSVSYGSIPHSQLD